MAAPSQVTPAREHSVARSNRDLMVGWTANPSAGDVPPASRAIQGNPSTATICGQNTSPINPAIAPRLTRATCAEPGLRAAVYRIAIDEEATQVCPKRRSHADNQP